jgi:hypothetical protein
MPYSFVWFVFDLGHGSNGYTHSCTVRSLILQYKLGIFDEFNWIIIIMGTMVVSLVVLVLDMS